MQLNYPIQVHAIILFICGRNINNNRICLPETMTWGKRVYGTSFPRRGDAQGTGQESFCPRRGGAQGTGQESFCPRWGGLKARGKKVFAPGGGGGLKARGKKVFGVLVLFFICNSSGLSVYCLLFSNG